MDELYKDIKNSVYQNCDEEILKKYNTHSNDFFENLADLKKAIKVQKKKNRIETAEVIFLMFLLPCILFKYFEYKPFMFVFSYYAVIALYFFVKRKIKLYRIKKEKKNI